MTPYELQQLEHQAWRLTTNLEFDANIGLMKAKGKLPIQSDKLEALDTKRYKANIEASIVMMIAHKRGDAVLSPETAKKLNDAAVLSMAANKFDVNRSGKATERPVGAPATKVQALSVKATTPAPRASTSTPVKPTDPMVLKLLADGKRATAGSLSTPKVKTMTPEQSKIFAAKNIMRVSIGKKLLTEAEFLQMQDDAGHTYQKASTPVPATDAPTASSQQDAIATARALFQGKGGR